MRPRPWWVAVQFLTVLPVHLDAPPDAALRARAALYYPLVGLALGAALAGLAWLLRGAPDGLAAALLLAAWVVASGGLHLDGLADSADAWVGGLGDRARTLQILKDPRCGPMGVLALALVLLVKFAALPAAGWPALLAVPLAGRAAALALLADLPYVRAGGIASGLQARLPRRAALAVLGIAAAAVAALAGPGALLAALAVYAALRQALRRRLGGTTGDTLGAAVELVETAVLVAAAL